MNGTGTVIASVTIAIVMIPLTAFAGLTGGGGGPFFGPMVLRSSDTTGAGGTDRGPGGVYFGAGGMGYAEFESFRIGGMGVGSSSGENAQHLRSSIGFGGVTLDMLLKPSERFTVPLGILIGAGGYAVNDMSGMSMNMTPAYSGNTRGDNSRTVTDSPFFMVGPKVGFATEVLSWLRMEGFGSFVAMFRDSGTSYAFLLSIGPIFGKFDMRPPNPACEEDFPGCRDRYNYPPSPTPPRKRRPAPRPDEEHEMEQGEQEQ